MREKFCSMNNLQRYRLAAAKFIAVMMLMTSPIVAQQLRWNPNGFMVKDSLGTPYLSAFSGGIGNARFQFTPLTSTNKPDLLLLNGDGKILFFKNTGEVGAPSFRLEPNTAFLPTITDWFRFHDFNGDGKQDLLKEAGGSASYYRNIGTIDSPVFALFQDTLRDQQNRPIIVESLSIPVIADIDGDGKPDVLSGNSIGTINFYKNISTNDTLKWQFVTSEFGCIRALADTVFVGNCNNRMKEKSPTIQLTSKVEHGASALSFGDLDGNGTLDLLFGDFVERSLYYFRNIGTPQSPQFELGAQHFPSLELLETRGFNLAQTLDYDADGDLDLFVSSLSVRQSKRDFIFFRNIGTPTAYNFIKETDRFLTPFDVGRGAKPALGDLNGDGKLDALIANVDGEIALYLNTGTPTSPEWTLQHSAYLIADTDPVAPALVDIDGDGDLDLFVGRFFIGRLRFFRNIGTPTNPQFVEQTFSPTNSINVGQAASPFFFDIDNDGDFDLFIGDSDGNVEFYRNTGTAQSAAFVQVSTSLVRLPNFAANASPCLIEENGIAHLFVGGSEGTIAHYRNTGTAQTPIFTLQSAQYEAIDAGGNASPIWADINGDSIKELFIGTERGGIELYDRNSLSLPKEIPVQKSFTLHQNYPNPFNPTTTLTYDLAFASTVRLEIFDVLGRKVATLVNAEQQAGRYVFTFNATQHGLTSGVYFCRLTTNGFSDTKKLLLMK